ncbi:P-loop containing nucleoside triphosphate hydrolase protein [Ramaria rubella]|nr:P-loop containing nucleoside triphosphate hydrolase protein [Ramaria rubella]
MTSAQHLTDSPFRSLGLNQSLLQALQTVNYTVPTDIQKECIPHALAGRDIGIASTGSGKTAAFALPILQKLWDEPQPYFACVLAPTRELAFQISEQFVALGLAMGARSVVIVGGREEAGNNIDSTTKSTKGFSLRGLKYLPTVLDMDFGPTINEILKAIPKERTTYLFSATMTTKVSKLQRASLTNPARVEASSKYQTVSTLLQYYVLVPLIHKDVLLVYLINSLSSNLVIIFTRTVHDAQRLNVMLRTLGFSAVPLHGQLSQTPSGSRSILFATDVASQSCAVHMFHSGLDIPSVDMLRNFDVPTHSKDYIHRVGRTARAGRSGKSITMITQYDVEFVDRLEDVLGKPLELWPTNKFDEAGRLAASNLRENTKGQKQKRKRHGDVRGDDSDRDDDVVQAGMRVG